MDDCYEINKGTLALIPIEENITKVIEKDSSFLVANSVSKIIDESCLVFGSSYQGRSEGAKTLLGINYKIPIVISESCNIIFFPTCSPRLGTCCWISLNNLVNYEKANKTTIINFENNKTIELNISSFIIENQIYKATLLESKLRKLKMN